MRKLPVQAALIHVWKSTFNNLSFAFHLSWPWMAVLLPVNLIGNYFGFQPEAAVEPSPGAVALTLVVGLVTVFAFASVAVSWHRYILKDEVPQGMDRLRADDTVWRYFGNSLLIVLNLSGIAIVAAFIIGMLALALGQFAAIIAVPTMIAAFLLMISVFYRMSVKLPAIALGEPGFTFRNAWQMTDGNAWRLIGLGLILLMIIFGISVAAMLPAAVFLAIPGAGLLFFTAIQIVANWIATILGVTTLTSLYGFFVQGRNF